MIAKSGNRLDELVAQTQRERLKRDQGYREQALKLFPWVCGRCGREFDHRNLRELTVHHRDHNHDNNPPDGSNWELLCLFCHDNEHSRLLENIGTKAEQNGDDSPATHRPFASLDELLKK